MVVDPVSFDPIPRVVQIRENETASRPNLHHSSAGLHHSTFAAFFDDAAIFPPGNAPMVGAVRAHLERRAQDDGSYVGPFVCPVSRLDELAASLGRQQIDVATVGLPDSPVPAGLTVVVVEIGDVDERPAVPDDVRVFVERPWDGAFDVPAGTMLKLRCGGAYVPSAEQLGLAIRHCVDAGQPFKLTAGLHHAVRTEGEHGFLNVLAAVDAAIVGRDPAPMLLEDNPAQLTVTRPAEVRRLFRSIGTCSIDEPLADLRVLGWVA